MRSDGLKRVFILGAGFSSYAGIPLQSEFTKALLKADQYPDHAFSKKLVAYLTKFVEGSFGGGTEKGCERWPELEDIFTCVDLSANSGHYLGENFSPAKLRTVRRALLARIIMMLRTTYCEARKEGHEPWRQLKNLIQNTDWWRSAAISLNWDTVLEEMIGDFHEGIQIDYGCDALPFPRDKTNINALPNDRNKKVCIVKMHGSTNWLYCDNCRSLFQFAPKESAEIAHQLIGEHDWNSMGEQPCFLHGARWKCAYCQQTPLGTRIATFSYRKALEFPMFQKSWLSAESILRNADTWIFIGYSLPPADYEFKYLLKRIQLSRPRRPHLILITGGDGAKAAENNYRRFFGSIDVFSEGITDEVLSKLSLQ